MNGLTTRPTRAPRQVVSEHGTIHQAAFSFIDWTPDRRRARLRYSLWCGRRGLTLVADLRRGIKPCGLCLIAMAAAQKREAA